MYKTKITDYFYQAGVKDEGRKLKQSEKNSIKFTSVPKSIVRALTNITINKL